MGAARHAARQPADQRYENPFLYGAICPLRGKDAALAMPQADAGAMQMHIEDISRHVAPGAHAVLLVDGAGWQTTRALPCRRTSPRSSGRRTPEPNPVENIWQYMRANWLSNRV